MTVKNRGIRYHIGVFAIAASCALFSACSQADVNTPEGLLKSLESHKQLDKAIPKISSMVTHPQDLEPYVPALMDLYMKGSSFDREVIQALAAYGKPDVDAALKKAASNSKDYKQVMQAAYGAKKTGNIEVISQLLSGFDAQSNPEVKRVILEIGTSVKSDGLTKKALDILNSNVDETSFNLLRTSCDVLANQKDPNAVDTLMKILYHQDGVGRTLTSNCTKALLALDREVVAPVLLKAFKLENPDLNEYVKAHPDTLTPETIRNNTANALALFRYEDAVEPMLDYLGNTHTIPVPGTLAIRPVLDPGWPAWASLVGIAAQSTIFALNDIGVKGNERAKKIFTDIFNWTNDYKSKFKYAIELTGTTNIEVSQRVNAFRALRENDLISNAETLEMVNALKGEEFQDEKKLRPWARASIGTDMVTYCAITAKPGDTQTIWNAFNELKSNEFNVPVPEDPDAPKQPHMNDGVSKRIDDVKPAFELADRCSNTYSCFAKELENADKIEASASYIRTKIIYELGFSGDHQYFDVICDEFKKLDAFAQMYATKSLAQLGNREDVPKIEELITKLSREMNQIQYQAAKPNLEGLITTLSNK